MSDLPNPQSPFEPPVPPESVPQAVPVQSAPPTDRTDVPPPARSSKWPGILGTIMIVYAGLQLFCGVLGAILAKWNPFPTPGRTTEVTAPTSGWMITWQLVSYAGLVLLLVAGIGVLQRRRWSLPLVRIWAAFVIVMSVVGAVMTSKMRDEVLGQIAGNSGPAIDPQVLAGIAFVSMAVGLLMGLVPPIFLLIWFARGKIKAEVAGWR